MKTFFLILASIIMFYKMVVPVFVAAKAITNSVSHIAKEVE